MSDLIIPDHVLASAESFLEKEAFFFQDRVSAVFKPMRMAYDDVGCYCVITMPNGDERFFDSYPALNKVVRNRVPISIKEGKKRIPYAIDLNTINSSIKLNHRNLYRNNLWFEFTGNDLNKVILNQSITPDGSEDVIYLLYSDALHCQFNLNDSNSAAFYVFNHLMTHTHLKEILPEEDYFSQFKHFLKSDIAHVELLKMYSI
jgi:hypothetical protein